MIEKEFFQNPHCMMCPNEIPAERRRFSRVNTCSKECADEKERQRREQQDLKVCRHCNKPSTLEQRAAYARFRTLERTQPHLLYPEEFAAWVEEQETFAAANKDARKKFPVTPAAFARYRKEKRFDGDGAEGVTLAAGGRAAEGD